MKRRLLVSLIVVLFLFCNLISFVGATTETRYMQSAKATVNGLNCFKFLTSQTSTVKEAPCIDGNNVGIRVWKRASGGAETEITSGTPVAQVTGPTSTTTLSNTWNCPLTSLDSTDSVVVRAYYWTGASWQLLLTTETPASNCEFQTEALGASSLDSATWTVYYAFRWVARTEALYYEFGTTTYNSRITSFTWTLAPTEQTENFYGTISPSFSIVDTRSWIFNRYSLIIETFTVTSTTEFISAQILSLVGAIALLFTLAKQKTIGFNRFGFLNPTFTVAATANFVSAQIINLYGLITHAFSIAFHRTFTFNLRPTINLVSAISSKMGYWYGIILNFYGSIVQTFTITFQKAFSFNIHQSILEHFSINQQKTWSFNLFPTVIETFAVNSIVNCWVGIILNLSGLIVFQFGVLVYTNLMLLAVNFVALGLSSLGLILCLYPLTQDDDSAKALAILTLVLSLAGIAFAILGLTYALPIGAVALILSVASIALVSKKD